MKRLRLDAVDLDIELRHHRAERGGDALQRALRCRVRHDRAGDRLQFGEIGGAVLQFDLHGKARGVADALDRRRRDHQHARFGNHRQPLVQPLEQRQQVFAGAALAPLGQHQVGDAGIRQARTAVERRDAGNRHDLVDARHLACDLLDLVQHLLGPLQRGAVRQLHRRQQIALVLDRDEAGRHARQAIAADADQDQRDQNGDVAVRDQLADQPGIAALHAVVDRVEAAVEPVALLRRHRPAQPERALRRLQRRRVDGRQ